MRTPTQKEYVHERLGDRFEEALSVYDTNRRIEILVDWFLREIPLDGKDVLEVGSGLGFFTEALLRRGATVTATDIGENMIGQLRKRFGCACVVADALTLTEQFGASLFDVVLSSECIEHTPDPNRALREMAGVLRAGGYLSVSTPNLVWFPLVRAATALRLRPFDGFENFSTFRSIRRTLESSGVEVLDEVGLHLFPFQLPFHTFSRFCDDHLQVFRCCMINLCVFGRKAAMPRD